MAFCCAGRMDFTVCTKNNYIVEKEGVGMPGSPVPVNDISHIFRSYDVRGVVGQDLSEGIMEKIGLAFGTYIKKDAVVACDVRTHSPALKSAFIAGFIKSGKNIEDIGILSLGSGMFHAWQSGKEFAFITASHLPKEWNGVKFFHADGRGFIEQKNYAIRDLFLLNRNAQHTTGKISNAESRNVIVKYINYLNSKVKIKKSLSVVLDCGNGCACLLAPELFKKAGCKVNSIFDSVDSNFPNREPDPIEKELSVLKKEVSGHDMGIAYDGDADRTAIIDDKGKFMKPEETSFIILSQLLKHEKGPVVANVECTRVIDLAAEKFGRQVIRVPVGHTFLMDAVHRNHAAFGVEVAGHYAIPHIIPFDDSIVIGLYLGQVISESGSSLYELRKDIPVTHFERLNFHCPDNVKFRLIKDLSEKLSKDFKNVNKMDGIRIDLDNGWCLIRVSNTSPNIRLTVEGSTEHDKTALQKMFLDYLRTEMAQFNLDLVPEHK